MKRTHIITILILSTLFLYYLGLNLLSPRTTDDYEFANHFITNQPLSSFKDILQNMVAQYMGLNGRVFTHLPIYIFCSTQLDWFFDTINAGAYILLIGISICYINYRGGFAYSLKGLIGCILAFWFLLPVPGETILWITGTFNYLWVALGMLFFLWLCNIIEKRQVTHRGFYLYIPFAFICGWSLEATSISLFFALCIYGYRHRSRLPKQFLYLFLPFLFGTLFVCLSPGIINRFWSTTSNLSWELSIASRIYTLYHFLIHAKASVLLSGTLLYLFYKKKDFLRSWFHRFELLFYAWITSILFLWIIGYNETVRGLFWTEVCAILLGLSLIYSFQWKISNRLIWATLGIACIGMAFEMEMVWKKWEKVHEGAKLMVTDFLGSNDGIVRNPINPDDLDSRYIYWVSFPNNWQVGEYYHRPYDMTMIPWQVYDAMHDKDKFFIPANEMFDRVYTLPEYLSYFIPLAEEDTRSWIPTHYTYSIDDSSLPLKELLYPIYLKVQNYYNQIPPRQCTVSVQGKRYLIISKIKRVPWFLKLDKVDIK